MEIKSSRTALIDFIKSLRHFSSLFPNDVKNGLVVYDGDLEQRVEKYEFVNWKNLSANIRELEGAPQG